MSEELKKYIGKRICIGHRRGEKVFFYHGELLDITATHLFMADRGKPTGFLLTELSKIELEGFSEAV